MVVTIYVYPADVTGCGHYRLIWPAQAVKKLGLDVKIIHPSERNTKTALSGSIKNGVLTRVKYPEDAELIIMQRPTHKILHQAVPLLRREGVAVIIDMDDDLSCIHPSNPAFMSMHPKNDKSGHNWRYAADACQNATMVTVSTPALAFRYAKHGRHRVLFNCVPERFLKITPEPSDEFGWAGSLHSHPDDLDCMGMSVKRLVDDGFKFKVVSPGNGVAEKLNLQDVNATGAIPMAQWPNEIAKLHVGVAPLADTRFNEAKSWLKPLEYGAVGIPWVAAPRIEYARLHRFGAGLTAKNPREWYANIKRLMTDDAFHKEHAEAARNVSAQYTYERNAELWAQTWTDTIRSGP